MHIVAPRDLPFATHNMIVVRNSEAAPAFLWEFWGAKGFETSNVTAVADYETKQSCKLAYIGILTL